MKIGTRADLMVARQERTMRHKLNIYLSQWRGWQQQALREGVWSVSAPVRGVMTQNVSRERRRKK